jgi:hypothetical protein
MVCGTTFRVKGSILYAISATVSIVIDNCKITTWNSASVSIHDHQHQGYHTSSLPQTCLSSGPKFPSEPIFKFVEMSGIFNIYYFFTLPPILKVQEYKKTNTFLERFTLTSAPCLHISAESGVMEEICVLTARLWYNGT